MLGSHCIVNISVCEVCPIIAHFKMAASEFFYISGSNCIVNISVLGGLSFIRPLQNGGFGTVEVS